MITSFECPVGELDEFGENFSTQLGFDEI